MKTQFIHIKDITEIETSRATVYDLNKRFIDPKGNMYGLRYNRAIKKIEVIRIMRTAAKNATYFTQQMVQNQRNEREEEHIRDIHQNDIFSSELSASTAQETSDLDRDIMIDDDNLGEIITNKEPEIDNEVFDPDIFINETLDNISIHRQRLNGIILNINNAKLYNFDDRDSSGRLDDLLRNIEIDGQQHIEKFLSYYRELKDYPRSIAFYTNKLEKRAQRILHDISTDGQKMQFIYLAETCTNFEILYSSLQKSITEILAHLLGISNDSLNILNQLEKQHLADAKTTIENTLSEIRTILDNIKDFEHYIYNSKRF